MAGIYIIKHKSGSQGYVGLDSGANGNQSGRLIDHVAAPYHIRGRDFYAYGKHFQIGELQTKIQDCEENIAKYTPSDFRYYLNTDNYYGLPRNKYELFTKVGKPDGPNPEQSGAEICYIYYYRHSLSTLNTAGGGSTKVSLTCNYLKNINLEGISGPLQKELQQDLKGSPTRQDVPMNSAESLKLMNQLFYPELKIEPILIKYCNNKFLSIFSIDNLVKGTIQAIKQEDLKRDMESFLTPVIKDCQIILDRIKLTSSIVQQANISYEINNNGLNELISSLNPKNLISTNLDTKRSFNKEKQKDLKKIHIIQFKVNLKLNSTYGLPEGFPEESNFNLTTFQNVTLQTKETVVTDIFPLVLRQANPMGTGIDFNTTENYFSNSLKTLYGGIINHISFTEYYNTMLSYGKRKIDGPFEIADFGGKGFIVPGVKRIRRTNWPQNVFITVSDELFHNMKNNDITTLNRVKVG